MGNPTLRLAARDLAALAATDPEATCATIYALASELRDCRRGPYVRAARRLAEPLQQAALEYARVADPIAADLEPVLPREPELPFGRVA